VFSLGGFKNEVGRFSQEGQEFRGTEMFTPELLALLRKYASEN
jgi:hypothetical protein